MDNNNNQEITVMATNVNNIPLADEYSPTKKSSLDKVVLSFLAVFITAVILFITLGARSYQWQLTLGGDKYEQAYAVAVLSDGGYATVGVTNSKGAGSNDIWLIKSAANSATEWEKVFGGTEWDIAESVIEVSLPAGQADQTASTNEKGYLVFGSTSGTYNGNSDFWLLKLDQQGNLLWEEKYGDASEDKGQVILSANDGGYYLIGNSSNESNGFGDALVIKVDSNGQVLWHQTYGGDGMDNVSTAQLTTQGDIIFGGSNPVGNYDFWLNKVDNQGKILWQKTAGTESSDTATDLVINKDGSIVMVGHNISSETGLRILMAIKFDATGEEIWQKEYRAIYNQWSQANAIVVNPNGGYVLAGKTKSEIQYDDKPHFEPWLISLDENGEKLWDSVLQQSGDHHINDLQRTEDGGLIAVGSRENQSNRYQSQNTQQKGDNLFIMKMDDRGNVE
jgi:hypothetical protein